MKYREQLSFIISFIALRILTIVLYTFFRPAQPGPYTSYIIFLYSVFDVLIIFFLYRYVKEIKQQRISIVAVLFIVLTIIFGLITSLYILPLDTDGLTPSEIHSREKFLLAVPLLVRHTMEFTIALQLLKNNVVGRIHTYLNVLAWSYLAVLCITFSIPIVDSVFSLHLPYAKYVFGLSYLLPLVAMILLYIQELRHFNAVNNELDGPTVDGRL